MAATPSKRSQRQAKKAMIQPALPLIPGMTKKQPEPYAASHASSVDEKDSSASPAAELDTTKTSRRSDASVNGSYPSSGRGDTPEQVVLTRGSSDTGLTGTSLVDAANAQNGVYNSAEQKLESADTESRQSFVSVSKTATPLVLSNEPASSSDLNTENQTPGYPAAVKYETSQYGQTKQAGAEDEDEDKAASVDASPVEIAGHPDPTNNAVVEILIPKSHEAEPVTTDPESKDAGQQKEADAVGDMRPPSEASNGHVGAAKVRTTTSLWPTITEHLLQLSHKKDWADWMVIVTGGKSPQFATYAHGMVLARSPRLRKIMEREAPGPQGNIINLMAPMPISPHAFEAALRFLYSDTVLSADGLFPDGPPARINFLPYILSYWVSGVILGIDCVVTRAVQLLRDFIDWDVVEAVLKEADDLGAGVNKDNLRSFPDWPNVVAQWKAEALQFCAARLNVQGFTLDTDSSSAIIRGRFAELEDRPMKHNPALASMVFGSMPTLTSLSPVLPQSDVAIPASSPQTGAASHILLNVDFQDLVFFYQQVRYFRGVASLQLVEEVVSEREKQRLRMISSRAIPNKYRMANSEIWDVAAYREYVENGELRRERVSFLLPTKQ